jgi:Calcineurin-like phosphoesterase
VNSFFGISPIKSKSIVQIRPNEAVKQRSRIRSPRANIFPSKIISIGGVRAQLPEGIRIYAVGDVHGRPDLLEELLNGIDIDCRQRPTRRSITVFIGDYIDRGPHSREVLALLLQWRQNNDAVLLRGNHETFLPEFLADSRTWDKWRLFGGVETLLSYGLQPTLNPDRHEQVRLADELKGAIPVDHLNLLKSLRLSYQLGDFVFVHAGLRPGIPIAQQHERDLLWIREEFLSFEKPFERFVIHGHTPVSAPDLRTNRLNIDTGAFATGNLTCIAIESSTIIQLLPQRTFSAP